MLDRAEGGVDVDVGVDVAPTSSVNRRWVRSKYTSECQSVSSASSATTSMPEPVVPAGLTGSVVEEAVAVDDHPGDLAGGHQAAVVVDRDRELQPTALDLLELGVGGDGARRPPTGARWSSWMRMLTVVSPVGELAGDGRDRRLLAQGDDARGGQDGDVAGAERRRRCRRR